MLEEMYRVREHDRAPFGDHWCGPARLRHAVKALVARYPPDPGGEGTAVEVFVEAVPARFYTICAGSFEVAFGSGTAELAAQLASMLAGGMLVIRKAKGGE